MAGSSATGVCECGCGRHTSLITETDNRKGLVRGFWRRFIRGHYKIPRTLIDKHSRVSMPNHPRASHGSVNEHVVIAERALGHYLPAGAHVHHVDGNKRNNKPSNLVICQDIKYHRMLHARARIVAAGGDPDTQRICGKCHALTPRENMQIGGTYCRTCANLKGRLFHAARRAHSGAEAAS